MIDIETLIKISPEHRAFHGRNIVCALADGLHIARQKHPVFAEGAAHALGVIGAEFRELEYAIEHESVERQKAEALDLAITALRFWLGEHEQQK